MVYGKSVEKTTLYLPRDLQRRLRDAARRSRKPQAELVREALRSYLDSADPPSVGIVGIVDDPELAAADSEAWLRDEWDRG
jgi:predicted transcriptional regulator